MSRSQPRAVALLLVLIGTAGSLAGQQRLTIDDFVGDWSANIAGTQWDLLFEEHRQYSIWRVTAEGDTLALSLGVWDFDGTRICVTPIGRSALCDAARIDNPRQPAMTEWRFQDGGGTGFGWLAYRRGYAPWDSAMPWRDTDVFQLDDVEIKPRMLGCSEPVERPPDLTGELTILLRFVVLPDSTVTDIEVVDAPTDAARQAAFKVAVSCRITPGALANGKVVRVRVELPLRFPEQEIGDGR
jgi:hypothetical protein